jgi:hypothetical protein
MKDVTCNEGQPATFLTEVHGSPTPNVQWFREGTLIPQSADFQVSISNVTIVGSQLVITDKIIIKRSRAVKKRMELYPFNKFSTSQQQRRFHSTRLTIHLVS